MLWCSRQQNSKMDRFPERIRRAVLMPAPLPPPSPPIPLLGFPLPLPPPPPLPKFEHLIMTRENAPYAGRDVFSTLIGHEVDFWRFTGETVASFMDVVQGVRPIFDANTASTGSKHKLGVENRLLMTYYWIKKYPDLVEMSVMFELSDKSISRDLHLTVDILWQYFQGCIRWPTDEEWIQMCGYWENIPDAVGAIDGTVHIIQMPEEDGHLYFSGHAHQYCISTQVICDNKGHIRHLHVSSIKYSFCLSPNPPCPLCMQHKHYSVAGGVLPPARPPICTTPCMMPCEGQFIKNCDQPTILMPGINLSIHTFLHCSHRGASAAWNFPHHLLSPLYNKKKYIQCPKQLFGPFEKLRPWVKYVMPNQAQQIMYIFEFIKLSVYITKYCQMVEPKII